MSFHTFRWDDDFNRADAPLSGGGWGSEWGPVPDVQWSIALAVPLDPSDPRFLIGVEGETVRIFGRDGALLAERDTAGVPPGTEITITFDRGRVTFTKA